MRYALLALLLLLGVPVTASAQLSIGISIGAYPHFDVVPGYPVYYATDVESNYFFFDGLYWVYQGDNWYSSSWYDGPWDSIDPIYVPVYLLQVPVRFYHRPPMYFRGWQADRAPRWGDHWGHDWDQRRSGWDRPREHMAPAPLPDYQRQYRGATYPQAEQQRALREQNYRYRPQAGSDRPAPGRPAPDRPAPAAVTPRPVENRQPNRDPKRIDMPRPVQSTQGQRNTLSAPAQQPAQRPEAQRPEAQRPEGQRPQEQRPSQPAQQRAAPERELKQPQARQGDAGRPNGRNGDGGGQGNDRGNGKQEDNRHQDR